MINLMERQGLVPLFYHNNIEICKNVIKACYEGGVRLIEFTNRGTFAHEVFSALSKYAKKELPELALGVGSVCDYGTAALYIQCGAAFIVTPSFREDVIRICNRRKILVSPGCGSLTEIGKAEELGCEIVKLFPGSVYSPGFIKGIKAPQPWTSIMPTGGVSPDYDNLKKWFDAGAYCVGMGSKLMVKDKDGGFDFGGIEDLSRQALKYIEEIRS